MSIEYPVYLAFIHLGRIGLAKAKSATLNFGEEFDSQGNPKEMTLKIRDVQLLPCTSEQEADFNLMLKKIEREKQVSKEE